MRMADPVTYADFEKLDIRVGTIGEDIGTKTSSAQITIHYKPDQLIGRQVCAVVNFPPRQVGQFTSEVLTLGLPGDGGDVILLRPDFVVPDGGKLF